MTAAIRVLLFAQVRHDAARLHQRDQGPARPSRVALLLQQVRGQQQDHRQQLHAQHGACFSCDTDVAVPL